ncbi:MAG TPA: argininosuccinate lyase [Anaerolineaceae bacterium]
MKLWGGRFSSELDSQAAQLNNSLPFDYRLGEVDVIGSIAWAKAIQKANILTGAESEVIISCLERILAEFRSGEFDFSPSDEDIHTAVERRLTELAGPVGGKLHTGRSRNDQVATDFRMWVMQAIDSLVGQLVGVLQALGKRAEEDMGVLLPGYTHTQRAQPIYLSHFWMGHAEALLRDRERFQTCKVHTGVLPLGSGALAGTSFEIDREFLAVELGFAQVSRNSLDAVADRDFAVEFLFAASLLALHLSRLADALILYSTAEFGFIEMADAYSTGSSLMPQKKNADPMELTRAKAGTILGRLTGLLAVLKGLPSAYDKDLQEDKQPVFDVADTLLVLLPVMAGVLSTLSIRPQKMRAALDPAMLATDLADYLVHKGIPFREAHHLSGRAVRRSAELGVGLNELPVAEFQAIHPVFENDVQEVFDFERSAAMHGVIGGTSPTQVKKQISEFWKRLASG